MTLTTDRPRTRLRQIPEARGNAVLGLLSDIRRDRLSLMLGLAERYGDAVRLSMGPESLYFFSNPDHAKHVLSDNPHHGGGPARRRGLHLPPLERPAAGPARDPALVSGRSLGLTGGDDGHFTMR